MIRTINLTTNVPVDRRVSIVFPKDVPIGPVEIEVKVATGEERLHTFGELARSEFFGMWRDRKDIRDSVKFARQLRKKAWKRSR